MAIDLDRTSLRAIFPAPSLRLPFSSTRHCSSRCRHVRTEAANVYRTNSLIEHSLVLGERLKGKPVTRELLA